MPEFRRIVHQASGETLIRRARWCESFLAKARGFTWRRNLAAGEGLVLVENNDSRISSAIHMLFVFFELGVLWVNSSGEVVDKQLARPWRLSYVPQAPARYVIEGRPELLERVAVGDHVLFVEENV